MTAVLRSMFSVIVCLALSATLANASTLYRWKDKDGNPVVSDRPPSPGVEYEIVSTSSLKVVNTADPMPAREASPAAQQPKEEAEQVTPKKSVFKKNPEYCTNARNNLQLLERPRIRIVGADGEGRFLTEEEREEERLKAREVIELHCD